MEEEEDMLPNKVAMSLACLNSSISGISFKVALSAVKQRSSMSSTCSIPVWNLIWNKVEKTIN